MLAWFVRSCSGVAVFFALALHCIGALAHIKSESHSVWHVVGTRVDLAYSVPVTETLRLAESEGVQPSDERVLDYLGRHFRVSAKGGACQPGSPRAVRATDQFRRFELHFECPGTEGVVLTASAFVDLINSHVNLAQIETSDGRFVEQIFTQERQTIELNGVDGKFENAGLLEYVVMGMEHIFTGIDHMSFLLGLVLLSRRARDLVFVVTGFTLGHSLTLALAVTGILQPQPEAIDALVALTIALIGAEAIAVKTHRPGPVAAAFGALLLVMVAARLAGWGTLPILLLLGAALFSVNYLLISGHLREAGRLRLVVTLVFGLIHGFGFAAGLLEFQMPPDRLLQILVGFNVGVEIGQMAVVFAMLGLVWLLRRFRLALPGPIVGDLVAAQLVGTGLYWYIGRSF